VTALLAISALVVLVLAYIGGMLHGSRIRRQALREAREPYLRELAELQVRQEELVRLARQWSASAFAAGDPLDLYTLARRACGEVVLELLTASASTPAAWKPLVIQGGREKRGGRA
jgi:hypothetical protein